MTHVRVNPAANLSLVAAVLWLASAACGGSSASPEGDPASAEGAGQARENKPSATRLCTAYCDSRQRCGLGPGADCVTSCGAEQRDNPHIRVDFAWHLLGCLDAIECPFVAQERAFQVCHEATTRRLDITKTLRRFCFESARKAAECGRRDEAAQGDCLDRYRYLKEDALVAGLDCLTKTCAAVPGCFGTSFGLAR